MPQFNPGEEGVAIATFPTKPAGLECTAELWLVSDMTKVATSGRIPFTSTGVDQTIQVPLTMPSSGTYQALLGIFTDNILIRAFYDPEEIVIKEAIPEGFLLSYTNPKRSGSTHWFASIYDVLTHSYCPADPSGEPLMDVPILFKPEGNILLLTFVESRSIFYDRHVYGPFVAEVEPGIYTWDAQEERLNGRRLMSLPESNNVCKVIGTVTGIAPWDHKLWLNLEEVSDISGYINAGQYFVGTNIEVIYSGYAEEGLRIEAKLKMVPGSFPGDVDVYGYEWHWELTNITFPYGYPPSYYQFTGTIEWSMDSCSGWPGSYGRVMDFKVLSSAGLRSYAVAVWFKAINYYTWKNFQSYSDGTVTRVEYIGGTGMCGLPVQYAQLWAHPDPEERFEFAPGAPGEYSSIIPWAKQKGWVMIAESEPPPWE